MRKITPTRCQTPHGRLIVQIEGADGLQFVVEKLEPQRILRLPREKVHDAATSGELPALRDDRERAHNRPR
jgi:hypothetical protein